MPALETERVVTRAEVAGFLREFADQLEGDDLTSGDEEFEGDQTISLTIDGNSATFDVPSTIDFEVDLASRSPLFEDDVRQEIEFELAWEVEEPADEDLEVQ